MMEPIKLWDNIPGFCEEEPILKFYPATKKQSDATVVIFSGGGYHLRAQHEGQDYAEYFNTLGMNAFVCEYRVAPHRHPIPLLDARRAVQYIRFNAEKFGINAEKIGVMGSSAGGHLAATVSTYLEEFSDVLNIKDEIDMVDFIPNFQILCYPVIALKDYGHIGSTKNLLGDKSEDENLINSLSAYNNVSEKTPKAFIWHTFDDGSVNVKNSLAYAWKLKEYKIDCEIHVYQNGPHGLGLALDNLTVGQWSNSLKLWLMHNGFLNGKI